MKAKWCIECQHHSSAGEFDEKMVCAKGHKPRFYMPKDGNPYSDYGWKRRCGVDFEAIIHP